MGRQRWSNASMEPAESSSGKRGRPSKVSDPKLVAMVEKALQDKSQPSSRLSWSRDKEDWVVVPLFNPAQVCGSTGFKDTDCFFVLLVSFRQRCRL